MFKVRVAAIFFVLGHPLLFGMAFCLFHIMVMGRPSIGASLAGEAIAAAVCVYLTYQSLVALSQLRFAPLESGAKTFVLVTTILCLALAVVNLGNAESSGLLSKGGSRLDFYFANDWFRRLVTYSYVPLGIASYYAVTAVISPLEKGRRFVFACFLAAQFFYSLAAGSKGAAVLSIAAAIPFVFVLRRFSLFKIGVVLLLATAAYLTAFLMLTTERHMSLLAIGVRFFLSIDMSILLMTGQGTAESLAGTLGDVWVEVFRNLGSLGVRISEQPIGVMVYQYTMGTIPTVGSNCRFGSLLLLYPDRFDFLLLFPVLVAFVAILFGEILRMVNLPRAALVATPWFAFLAFQDAYWFVAHVMPIIMLFTAMKLGQVISRGSFHRTPNAA